MKPVTINCLYYSKDSEIARIIGKDEDDISTAVAQPVTFFTISAVAKYYDDNDKEYGTIITNGSEFITTLSYTELVEIFTTAHNQ
jgi:hypothetical protein